MGWTRARRGNLNGFSDRGSIGGYALEAMSWAVGEKLMDGVTASTIEPQGKATRAQAAAILMRFMEYVK